MGECAPFLPKVNKRAKDLPVTTGASEIREIDKGVIDSYTVGSASSPSLQTKAKSGYSSAIQNTGASQVCEMYCPFLVRMVFCFQDCVKNSYSY